MGAKARKEPRCLAWHFIASDRKLGHKDGREVVAGETLSYEGEDPPECYIQGMHASVRARDAVSFRRGTVVCRVEVWGDVQQQNNKLKVLWMADATEVLRQFARECALRHIGSWDAPAVVKQYLETGEEGKRAEAWAAAANAVDAADAADAAAANAAYAAAVGADGAAYAAAVAAAYAAYANAATYALTATDTVADAAAYAAREQEREWQNTRLTELLEGLYES